MRVCAPGLAPRCFSERAYLSLRTKSQESGAALTSYSASRIESGIIVPSCHVAVAELTADEARLTNAPPTAAGGACSSRWGTAATPPDRTTHVIPTAVEFLHLRAELREARRRLASPAPRLS
jgi:hypothetical protein